MRKLRRMSLLAILGVLLIAALAILVSSGSNLVYKRYSEIRVGLPRDGIEFYEGHPAITVLGAIYLGDRDCFWQKQSPDGLAGVILTHRDQMDTSGDHPARRRSEPGCRGIMHNLAGFFP